MNCPIKSGFTLFLALFLMVPRLHAESDSDKKDRRTVTVQGQGKVRAVPDIATLSIGVSQDGSSAEAVSTRVRDDISKVLEAIKAQGIPDKDVQTQYYAVQPKWDWSNGKQRRIGFTVSNQVAVKVRDLKKVGHLLSSATEAGATSISGPDFDFDDPQQLERKALAAAMEDAKAKAAVLAEAAGASLGDVMTIEQNGGINWPMRRPLMSRAALASPAAAPEPIETGEQVFNSTITVTFALK